MLFSAYFSSENLPRFRNVKLLSENFLILFPPWKGKISQVTSQLDYQADSPAFIGVHLFLNPEHLHLIWGEGRVLCGQGGSLELQPTRRVCQWEGKSDTSEESPTPRTEGSCQQPTWGYSSATHLGKLWRYYSNGQVSMKDKQVGWNTQLRKCLIFTNTKEGSVSSLLMWAPTICWSWRCVHSTCSYSLPGEITPYISSPWSNDRALVSGNHIELYPEVCLCCLQLEISHQHVHTGMSQLSPALMQMWMYRISRYNDYPKHSPSCQQLGGPRSWDRHKFWVFSIRMELLFCKRI